MFNWRKWLISLMIALTILPLNMITVKQAAASTAPVNITSIELKDQRTRYTKTFQKSNGKKEVLSYQQPIHYQTTLNGKTAWNDINTGLNTSALSTLSSTSASQTSPESIFTNKANDFQLQFNKNITTDGAVITKDNASVSMKPTSTIVNGTLQSPYSLYNPAKPASVNPIAVQSSPSIQNYATNLQSTTKLAPATNPPVTVNLSNATPIVSGNKLTYKNIVAATDLIYYSVADGFKEDIILNQYYGQNAFKFDLKLSNTYFEKQADGSYYFYDKTSKKLVFNMPKLYMWDSKGGKGSIENEYSFALTTQLIAKATGYDLILTADHTWLADPKRVYPVTIDPSVSTGIPYGLDTYVQEGFPNYNMWVNRDMYVGRGDSKKRTIAFLPFNIDLTNKIITNATVSVYQISCYGASQWSNVGVYASQNYDPQNVTWNNQPNSLDRIGYGNNSGVNTWLDFNVTDGLKHWFEAKNESGSKIGSFEFIQENSGSWGYRQWVAENHPDGWAQDKKPNLRVEYIDYNAQYSFSGIHDAKVKDTYSASVRVKNTGTDSVWSPGNTMIAVGARNNTTGAIIENKYYDVPYNMGNGAEADFPFQLDIPDSPGNYSLFSDVYRSDFLCANSGEWGCHISEIGATEGISNFSVTDYPVYAAEISPQYPSAYMAGSTSPVTVSLRNAGRLNWSASNFSLGYQLIDSETGLDISHQSIPLSRDVQPAWGGDQSYLIMQMDIKVPLKIGKYTLKFDILESGTGFATRGVSIPSKEIELTAPSFSSIIHTGVEDRYAMVGPIDATTGGLVYSVGDVSMPTLTGGLNIGRNYNSNLSDNTFSMNSEGYITKWLINGPYYETNADKRFDTSYVNEASLKPSNGMTTNNRVWFETGGAPGPNVPPPPPPPNSLMSAQTKSLASMASGQNFIDLSSAYGTTASIQKTDNQASYASVYVYSPSSQNVKYKVGSDDSLKVWLNGTLVYSNKIIRTVVADSDTVTMTMKAGWNRLMMKVAQGNRGNEFVARFTDSSGNPATNLKFSLNNPDIVQTSTVFGKNWSPNFLEKLDLSDGQNVYYLDGSNSVNIYTKKTDGSYQKPAGSGLNLVKNTNGTYSLADKFRNKNYYRSDGLITSRTDLLGNSIYYLYDSAGNCNKIYDRSSDNKSTRFFNIVYTNGLVSSITNQIGITLISYTYASGFLTKVTDQMGNSVDYSYDCNGKMVGNSNKKKQKTIISYIGNKVSSLQDALGNITKLTYSTGSVEITDPLNRKSTINYDPIGKMMNKFTDATGYAEKFEYDANYNITRVYPMVPENDGLFFSIDYTFDQNNNLIATTDPLGNKSTVTYVNNYPTKQTDPSGNIVSNTYDTKGRVTSSTDAKGNVSTYTYDMYGHLLTETDPAGNKTTNAYNVDGDLISVTSPKGENTSFTFNSIGRKLTQKSPMGNLTQFNYDLNGQMIAIGDAAGLWTKVEYDTIGNITKQTNPRGFSKVYTYDAGNKLTSSTDEVGAKISYAYDKAGNQTKLIDANGKVVSYEYDALNQLTKVIDARGKTATVVYDKNGNVTNSSDFNGNQYSQKLDKAGQPIEIMAPNGTSTLKYDKNGNIIEAANGTEKTTIAYDKNNNSTTLSSSTTGTVNSEYDKNDNITKVTTSSATVGLSYDKNNKISQISQTVKGSSQTLTSLISLDPEGKLNKITKANGDTAQYAYDKSGRVTSFTNTSALNAIFSKYTYQYDTASNITAITEAQTNVTNSYGYDGRNQLIKENAIDYTYDLMGNRTKMVDGTNTTTYAYDTLDANQLKTVTGTKSGTTSYEYDNNGNIIKKTDPSGITTYAYDSDGYFIKAVLPDKTAIVYTYDKIAKLRTSRVQINPSGTTGTTKFIWESDRLVAETDGFGKIVKAYAWDENEKLLSVSLIDTSEKLLTFFYLKNAKGDITGMTDQNGKQVANYTYDAWGNIKKSTAAVDSPIANIDKVNNRLYAGYWYDQKLGSYFMKTRLYDPKTARFLSKDPVQSGIDAADYNPYIYCNNSPLNRIDPNGKVWLIAIGAVVGAVVGGAIDAVIQYKTTGNINWGQVGAAALGGAVAGAVFAATGGFGGSLLGLIGAGAISGAAGGVASYTASNWGHLSIKGAAKAAGAGALAGAIGGAVGYGVGKVLSKVVSIATTSRISTSVQGSGVSQAASKAQSAGLRTAPKPVATSPSKSPSYTKSSLQRGQAMHKTYKADLADDDMLIKEFRFDNGKRADFIDLKNKIIYELKPNNPRSIKAGLKQLAGYQAEANRTLGGRFTTVLDLY